MMEAVKEIDLIGYQLALVWSGVVLGCVVGFWLGVLRCQFQKKS